MEKPIGWWGSPRGGGEDRRRFRREGTRATGTAVARARPVCLRTPGRVGLVRHVSETIARSTDDDRIGAGKRRLIIRFRFRGLFFFFCFSVFSGGKKIVKYRCLLFKLLSSLPHQSFSNYVRIFHSECSNIIICVFI